MLKVLLTSISNKTSLIHTLKKSFLEKNLPIYVFGGDSSNLSVAKYFVDEFWNMSRLENLPIQEVVEYCIKNCIEIIFPTRDEDLVYFSANFRVLQQNGIHVMVSTIESLKNTQDKFLFFELLDKKNYPVIPTYLEIGDMNYNLFVVKERFGSGSKGIQLKVSKSEAKKAALNLDSPIFQPFIEGTEYSIDVYVDQKGRSKAAIVRERVLVVGGESKITKTVSLPELEQLAMKSAEELNLSGHIMFQIILDEIGGYHIMECNPRFGGASTLSVEAGLDSFFWFYKEVLEDSLNNIEFNRTEKELTLVRHSRDLII